MKIHIRAIVLSLGFGSFCFHLRGQDISVSIEQNETASCTMVPESGITLIADATPANGADGECIDFDWTDEYGVDWGEGSVMGLQSQLQYTAPPEDLGSVLTMTCTVTDGVGDTNFDDVSLAVLQITPIGHDAPVLSYYNGTTVSGVIGGGQTSLRVNVLPTLETSGCDDYDWEIGSGSTAITHVPDSSEDFDIVSSCGESNDTGDQDLQINDDSGNLCADLTLTVDYPSDAVDGSPSYTPTAWPNTAFPIFYGWSDLYPVQILNQFENTGMADTMPDNTPIYESFVGYTLDDGDCDWPLGSSANWVTNGGSGYIYGEGQWGDLYAAGPSYALIPQPVWKTDPSYDPSDMEFHVTQKYTAGGSTTSPGGVAVLTHTLNFHLGYADLSP